METKELIHTYLLNCERRGLSPATLRWYGFFLKNFAREHPELPLKPEPIEEFIYSHKTGDERRYGAFRCLRAFYNFVESRVFIEQKLDLVNPFGKMLPPRRSPKEKWALNLDELRRLLEYPEHDPIIRTLLYLLADTGIRIGEAVSLIGDNVFIDSVKVKGKTGERIIPISAKVREMLIKLGPGKLFPHKSHWWSMEVSRAFKEVGLPGTAHTLRHTFCTLFEGTDQSLMTITGHKSFQVVQQYTHKKLEKAQKQHQEHGPLARLYGEENPQSPQNSAQGKVDNSTLQMIVQLAREVGELKEQLKHNGGNGNKPKVIEEAFHLPALFSEGNEELAGSPINILQIMPANGWKAIYGLDSEDGKPNYFRKHLVCFAVVERLIESPQGFKEIMRDIEGFDVSADCGVLQIEGTGNFLGYEAPGEKDDEDWEEAWQDWQDCKGVAT